MSSSWFEPPMSVNIRPLLWGSWQGCDVIQCNLRLFASSRVPNLLLLALKGSLTFNDSPKILWISRDLPVPDEIIGADATTCRFRTTFRRKSSRRLPAGPRRSSWTRSRGRREASPWPLRQERADRKDNVWVVHSMSLERLLSGRKLIHVFGPGM